MYRSSMFPVRVRCMSQLPPVLPGVYRCYRVLNLLPPDPVVFDRQIGMRVWCLVRFVATRASRGLARESLGGLVGGLVWFVWYVCLSLVFPAPPVFLTRFRSRNMLKLP